MPSSFKGNPLLLISHFRVVSVLSYWGLLQESLELPVHVNLSEGSVLIGELKPMLTVLRSKEKRPA